MVKETDICERIAKNEVRIQNINEKIRDLKNDLEKNIKELDDEFKEYKEQIETEKKHKENMLLLKLSIIALFIIFAIEILIRFVFPS